MNMRSFLRILSGLLALSLLSATFGGAQQAPPSATPKTKIRAITAFARLERGRYQMQLDEALKFLKIAKTTFESRDFTVQTLRIATEPFPEYTEGMSRDEALQFFKNLEAVADSENVMLS